MDDEKIAILPSENKDQDFAICGSVIDASEFYLLENQD